MLIFAAGCYWYYQHTTAHDRAEAGKAEQLLKQWEAEKAKPTTPAETASPQAAAEDQNTTAEKPVHERIPPPENDAQSKPSPTVTPTAQVEKADELVSPHGFGPFPQIPEGYLGKEVDPNFWTYDWDKNGELVHRVLMKLWEEGTQAIGATMSNGLIYPNYPNTLIVEWKAQRTLFGTRRYASRTQGSPETESFLWSHRGPIYESDIPSNIKVIEFKDAGIDPYDYLDLPR